MIARFPEGTPATWIARRWYYMPKSRRDYSVRAISPGDRRLLAEFALDLSRLACEKEMSAVRDMTSLLFDRVMEPGPHGAVGFAALESATPGDRVIGAAVYAPCNDGAEFCVAVAGAYRTEQVGTTLMAALVKHARRVGIARLTAEIFWSNRPMQLLAQSMGFLVEPVARDRNLRRLVLALK
jgi:RimJ/RimL family protein N-acetyltransferase